MNNRYRLKTKSIWGQPTEHYFRFLQMIEKKGLPKTICILGCSDGKFVLPAAKRGFKVLAIDIDKIAIYGGKTIIDNKETIIEGMVSRLKKEQLETAVEVVATDYIAYRPTRTYSGVFTSGSFHYQEDAQYPFDRVIERIKRYVSLNGLIFLEYIHKSEVDNDPQRHFVTAKQIASYFRLPQWKVRSNKAKVYIENPNPRVLYEHKIVWGRLYVEKLL